MRRCSHPGSVWVYGLLLAACSNAPSTPATAAAGQGGTAQAGGAAGQADVAGNGGSSPVPVAGSDAGGSGGGGGAGESAGAGGESALPVSAFLASLGVCVHIGQGVDDAAKSATAMAFAGIRNLRDDGNHAHIKDWIAVYQQARVKTVVLTDQDVASTVDIAKQLHAAGALLAVEGPNEPNNFGVTYENQKSGSGTTFLPVAHLQRDLYRAIKEDPGLNQVPVFHSSEAGGSEPDNVGLQFLTIPLGTTSVMPAGTGYADFANTHNYICGHQNQLSDNLCWNAADPALNGDWDGLFVEYGHTWGKGFTGYSNAELETLPRVTTETGWVTSGPGAISEEQQARLFLNLYLSAFKRHWAYTFIYMLRDDPVQGYWGLFGADYQPKKSGQYLHNLTTILADEQTAAAGSLAYALREQPATVHDLLLRKSSGAFELLIWNERPGGGSDHPSVELTRTRASVKIYDPTLGASAVQTLSNVSSVPLELSDHPLVLEFE
jgi:hypothetical protein